MRRTNTDPVLSKKVSRRTKNGKPCLSPSEMTTGTLIDSVSGTANLAVTGHTSRRLQKILIEGLRNPMELTENGWATKPTWKHADDVNLAAKIETFELPAILFLKDDEL